MYPHLLVALAGFALLNGCAAPTDLVTAPSNHPASVEIAAGPLPQPLGVLATADPISPGGPAPIAQQALPHRHHDTTADNAAGQDHARHHQHAPAGSGTTRPAPTQPASPTLYTCAHHPEVVSEKPGTCPKCKMQLSPTEATPATKPARHEAGKDHGGHQHHEHGEH